MFPYRVTACWVSYLVWGVNYYSIPNSLSLKTQQFSSSTSRKNRKTHPKKWSMPLYLPNSSLVQLGGKQERFFWHSSLFPHLSPPAPLQPSPATRSPHESAGETR